MKTTLIALTALALLMPAQAVADTVPNDSTKRASSVLASSDRKVMLNAESSTTPRTINIGIPISGDLVIEENDVPVVYFFYPTIPIAAWRNDESMGQMGLSTFGETAIRTGKVGLAVETGNRHASNRFKGYAQFYVDNYGSSRYNVCLTGPISKNGWGYMVDFYQNNERANGTDYKFYNWKDRTTMVKAALEKKYKNGNIRLIYKFTDFKYIMTNYSPMIYEGDGKTKALDNFRIGKDAFIVGDGMVPYYDPYTGEAMQGDMASDKFLRAQTHTIQFNGEHRFRSGFLNKWRLNYTASFMHDNTPFVVNFPISLMAQMPDQQGSDTYYYHGTNKQYHGSIAWVMGSLIPQSNNNYFAARAELKRKVKGHDWRFGLNVQHYHRNMDTYTAMYITSVEPNPALLDYNMAYEAAPGYTIPVSMSNEKNGAMALRVGGGYGSNTNDFYTKAALYASDEFNITRRWTLGLGVRAELQNLTEHKIANGYTIDERGGYNYETWDKAQHLNHNFGNNLNYSAAFNTLYKIGRNWGLLADGTVLSWKDSYWDYECRDANNNPAGNAQGLIRQNQPGTYRSTVTNFGAGLYFNWGTYLQVVSKVLLTTKDNIRFADAIITNPANPTERTDCGPIYYDMRTLGWTTDIMANPFKGFNFHFLVTWQKPQYKNFEYSAYGVTYNYSNNTITSLSKFLMEIDPSYTFMKGKVRAWMSLRYFGKQYGNPTNAFYYNGWWENFGGIDLNLSRAFTLKFQVTNFLDEDGVKGDIQGANQITDAKPYFGRILMAQGIRPRTFEVTASFKF